MSNVKRSAMSQALTQSNCRERNAVRLEHHRCVEVLSGTTWNCHYWANVYLLNGKFIYLSVILYRVSRVKEMRVLADTGIGAGHTCQRKSEKSFQMAVLALYWALDKVENWEMRERTCRERESGREREKSFQEEKTAGEKKK